MIGNGCPDIIVGFQGKNYMMEIKNPKTKYGKRGPSRLQQDFAARFFHSVHVVRSAEEALAVIGIKV